MYSIYRRVHLTTLQAPKRWRPCLSQRSLCVPRETSLPLSSEKYFFSPIAHDSKSFRNNKYL